MEPTIGANEKLSGGTTAGVHLRRTSPTSEREGRALRDFVPQLAISETGRRSFLAKRESGSAWFQKLGFVIAANGDVAEAVGRGEQEFVLRAQHSL